MLHLPPPVKPLPLLPPLFLSLSLMVAQNLRHLSEAVLTRRLRTRTTLANLSISLSPFQLHVKDLGLFDTNTEPLLTVDKLNVRISRKKVFYCDVIATGLVLHADVSPVDWQVNNWSAHLLRITQETGFDSRKTEQPPADEGKEEWNVRKNTIVLSIATQRAAIRIKQPSITLPLPPLVIPGTGLSSIPAIHDLVNGLLGKAARDAGSKSFPRELRTGARRAARGVTVIAVDKFFANAEIRIGQWRKKVDQVRNYLEDIPGVDDAQRKMKNVGGILRMLEIFLSSERTEVKDRRLRDQEGVHACESGMRELDELNVEE